MATFLTLMLALSGCFGGGGDDETPTGTETSTGTSTGTGTSTSTSTGTETSTTTQTNTGGAGNSSAPDRNAVLEANQTEGEAPFAVGFSLDVRSFEGEAMVESGNYTWTFVTGAGGDLAEGTQEDIPGLINHTYEVAGNFTASFAVTFADGSEASATVNITTTLPEDPAELPPLHFEFGETAGCSWDLPTIADGDPTPCISQAAGPSQPPVDGHWIPLDERYIGFGVVSTVDKGEGHGSESSGDPTTDWPQYDTDCFFIAADEETVVGDGNNGPGSCAGVVPADAAWLFVTPYGTPWIEFILDFQP